ncbi:MAG: fdhD [Verrucomicrobiales bacterium]|nr:fdhD [Verrucomicrobiales bacterium]
MFTSSSCGICSKTDLTTAIPPERVLRPGAVPVISAAELAGLPELLRAAQPAFAATGGLHGCAWWDGRERRLAAGFLFEDVGRHNALDKLLGHALLTRRLPLSDGVLVLSGRISFELVQKASAAGIPVIAAVGAPSSLAIAYAEAAGITLCGFVRDNRFNVYTHPSRVGA